MKRNHLLAAALCALLSTGGARAQTQTFLPVGPGLMMELICLGAPENWECVNDPVSNDGADFVQSPLLDSVLKADLYALDIPKNLTGHVQIVTVNVRLLAVDAVPFPFTGAVGIVIIADGPVIHEALVIGAVPLEWTDYSVSMAENPITGHAWRKEELSRMQFGLRVFTSTEEAIWMTRLVVGVTTSN